MPIGASGGAPVLALRTDFRLSQSIFCNRRVTNHLGMLQLACMAAMLGCLPLGLHLGQSQLGGLGQRISSYSWR